MVFTKGLEIYFLNIKITYYSNLLDRGDSKSKLIAIDIQKSVEDVLDSEELEFISTDSYKIYVESNDGEIIN